METKEVKQLLQRYFNGESTLAEERLLEKYFQSGKAAGNLKKYAVFFTGISELAETGRDAGLEDEIMEFIRKNEPGKKTNTRRVWQIVTGIAASIIIVLGGVLFYQHENEPFKDTFDNPEMAYAYAGQTLEYVSAKYNKGLSGLANFGRLEAAIEPMQKGVKPINEYMEMIERIGEQ